jgi:hypothetical protein
MFKGFIIFLSYLILFVCPFVIKAQTTLKVQDGSFYLPTMTSVVTTSENEKYIFILRSSRSIDKEINEARENWKIDGLSKKVATQAEKILLRDAEKEKALRLKYKESGLYKNDSNQLIFNVESFPQETDKIFVANDGSYIVGFNPFVFVQEMTKTKPEDIMRSQEIAFFTLTSDDSNVKPCSYKIADLNLEKNSIQSTSDGYFWANRNASLNNENYSLEIIKSNGEKIVFDVKNCKVIQDDAQKIPEANSSNKNGQSSFCFGIALLIMLASWRSS